MGNNIRKGISIYYFINILNHVVETFNKGNYIIIMKKPIKMKIKKKKI